MAPVPDSLVRAIDRGQCVAFLGAGFSAAANLPGWGELLIGVARSPALEAATREHVGARVRVGTAHALDEAAQALEDALGREALHLKLGEALGRPAMTDAMRKRIAWLRGIPFRAVLTTNFDGLLDGELPGRDAYRDVLRREDHGWWEPRFWRDERGPLLVKLHGNLLHGEPGASEVVLTRQDYRRRLYTDPAYVGFLRALMATTTILYMGFSFEDAYLNELRSEILSLLGYRDRNEPVAYAILNDVPRSSREHMRRHEGIEVLSYDSKGATDFSGFDRHLEEIHARTNPILRFGRRLADRRILWLDPHPDNNDVAFDFLARAAAASGRRMRSLETVATADEALRALEGAEASEPFDLVVTHWGEGATRDEHGQPTAAAQRLLTGLRSRDLQVPVIVFAAATDAGERKRRALRLGALAYCFEFGDLLKRVEDVFAPLMQTT